MILYMYIALGQGLTTPWGRNFDVNRNILSLRSFVASFKKNLFDVWFYTYTYYSPRTGAESPQGIKFWYQQKCLVLSLHSFVTSFKKMSLKSDFIQFFSWLYIYVYSPGARTESPQGTKFDVNRKALPLYPFVAGFKEISLKVWCYTHVYSPRAGQDRGRQPPEDKFWCQQKCLVLSLHSFVTSFKKCLWSLILYNFFSWLNIYVYSPGAGTESPQGRKFDVNRKALPLYPFVAGFKEISLKVWCYTFFSWFNICIYM